MTPPPDSGGQINSFGMLPPVDTGRLDTDHIGESVRFTEIEQRSHSVSRSSRSLSFLSLPTQRAWTRPLRIAYAQKAWWWLLFGL